MELTAFLLYNRLWQKRLHPPMPALWYQHRTAFLGKWRQAMGAVLSPQTVVSQ